MDIHDIPKADSAEGGGSAKRRSRAGCLTCRRRRVKCDEARPTCGKCAERSTACEWPAAKVTSHHRHPRAIRSCESCRTRKTKCEIENGINGPCTSCINYGSECVWPRVESLPLDTLNDVHRQSIYDNPTGALPSPWPAEIQTDLVHANSGSRQDVIGVGNEDPTLITELLRLYFGTVHYFGFLTFIHEADFWDRFEHGTVPEPLTLLMAANALRFGRGPNAIERLHLADKWAAEAGKHVMGQAMLEFGAMELMMVVLYHHYEFQCGRYSRGWVLAGMAVRMMTFLRLHMFDEFPHHINKPMLDGESLRRLAWSVYYLDATMDGGHHGFTAIPDGAFTIPLPCDEKPFLRHQPTSKEYMLPSDASAPSSDLGLAGYLLRAMYARQILAGLHSRIQRQLVPISMIPTYVKQAESDARQLLGVLPPDLEDSRINFHIWKGQQTIFLHLHVLRNTCLRHLALLKILCAPHLGDDDVSTQRDQLVYEASQMSGLFSLSLDRGIVLDPQMAMHAYNGLEILLYQPLRRRPDSPSPPPSRAEISTLILPFLKVLRDVAEVSELVSLLYPEAVNRMVRVGYTEHLSDEDMLALLRRVHRLANPDSEFDFHDSFWRYEVAVSRLKGDGGDPVSPNDLLLEVRDHAGPSKKTAGGEEQASPLSRLQAVFGPSQSRQNACNEAWRTSGDVPAYILPVENLETLIGGTRQPGQMGIPLDWSLSGIDL